MTKKTAGSKKSKPAGRAAKKSPKRAGVKKDPARTSFEAELKSLIPQLDSGGLAFLVQQARVHLYNMQVDKLNQATIEANLASIKAEAESKNRRAQAQEPARTFSIAGRQAGNYYIYYGNNNTIFTGEEMGCLVNIVYSEGSELEIRERLFNWFKSERLDFFAVASIADKFDKRLNALAAVIKKYFKKPRRRG